MTMHKALALFSVALLSGACGSGDDTPPPQEPVIDDSCGLDCAAQETYGLVVKRCFEYSDDPAGAVQDPPALGVYVLDVEELEGGVRTLPVIYNTSGLLKLTDHFTLTGGKLTLVRRSFTQPVGSISYEDASGKLTGLTWLDVAASASTVSSTAQAKVVGALGTDSGNATLRVDVKDAQNLVTPAGSYETARELLMLETPDRGGADARRFFVEDVGFVRFFADFNPASGTASEYRLQRIRDVAAGDTECGL